jgi:hypothetical protein
MRFVMCTACGDLFAAQPSRYYWCACGEPLTEGDEIRALVPTAGPRRPKRKRRPLLSQQPASETAAETAS